MNKRLRLVGIGFLCCSLMVTSFPTITQAKENTSVIEIESSSELDLKQAEKTAIAFIEECYSDGVIDKSQDSDLIAQNADSLRKAIAYRKAIKKSSSISQLKLLSFTVQEVESEVKGPKEIEVFLDTMEKNGEGDSNEITQERQNFYKLSLVKEDGKWRVLKVISDDFTGASLNPKLICIGKDEFKSYDMAGYDALIDQVQLDREINVAKENKAYFEREQAHYEANKVEIEAKERREEEAYILEKNRELEIERSLLKNRNDKASKDQLEQLKNRSFHSFNRTAMKNYQLKNWNGPNVFSLDCTNYTSNVVKSGGAKMDYSGHYKWFFSHSGWPAGYSKSWTVVRDFRDYFINSQEKDGPHGVGAATFGELNTGDIVQMNSDFASDYNHACTILEKGGDPIVTAHTKNYKGRFAKNFNHKISKTYKIKLKGYYS